MCLQEHLIIVSIWWSQCSGQGLISELIISLTFVAINSVFRKTCWNTSSGWFFPSVSYRWDCPEKVSFTEEIPDENKSESAVQSMSSGCNQPEHATPVCVSIHWAHVACTESWVWHTLDVLAPVRLCRGSGSHQWRPSIMLMWLLMPPQWTLWHWPCKGCTGLAAICSDFLKSQQAVWLLLSLSWNPKSLENIFLFWWETIFIVL